MDAAGAEGPRAATGAAVLAAVLFLSPSLYAQSPVLRGELLLRNGEPATDVRVVVVGHPPEVAVRDGAVFSHVLSGDPSEVTIRVVGRPGTEVLFPPGGRQVVPRDPDVVVPVLVGERIGVAVEDRIDRDLRNLRETLAVRGVSEEQIEAVIRRELDGLVERIATVTEGAVERAVAGSDRSGLRDRVSRYLSVYVLKARDLVDVFGIVEVDGGLSESEFHAVYRALGEYNDAYESLDRELGLTPTALRRAWPGDAGERLERRLTELLELIRDVLHGQMLALRRPLVVIQGDFTGVDPGDEELRSARRAIAEAMPPLTEAMERVESEVPALLDMLRESPRP